MPDEPSASPLPAERVTGIGGVFFKSPDPAALRAWYRTHLGVESGDGAATFRWREPHRPDGTGMTVWSPFRSDTTYFAPSAASFMVNFRVADLGRMLAQLRSLGATVDDRVDDSEYGRFGWVFDLDGNKVELWEPPA